MKKSLIVTVALVAAIVIGIAVKESLKGGGQNPMGRGGPREVAVHALRVMPEMIQQRAEAIGTAYAQESVEIASNVTETIESIHFTDGMKVKKGDVLVVLTNSEEQAELLSAQASLKEQEREVKRLQGLVKTNSVSQSALDERLTQEETAQRRVDVAEARLHDRIIRAPFSGVLGLRQISPGTLVGPGTVITTLDDVDTIKLDFAVPAIYLTSVKTGIQIEARSPALADRVFKGKIVSVDSRINPVDRSIKVRAQLPNKDNAIKPGMLMHVDVLVANREALIVPETAIIPRGDEHFVYVVTEDKPPKAQLQAVTVGIRQPGRAEITSGLSEGQWVISGGTGTVDPGATVRVLEQESEPAMQAKTANPSS